jgi:hypothetical protein
VAVIVGQAVVHPAMYGPLAALYSEMFATRSRYTGASLGYQIAGIGAGIAPVAFASVLGATGSVVGVSVAIAAGCLLTVGCILATAETAHGDLTGHDVRRRTPAR